MKTDLKQAMAAYKARLGVLKGLTAHSGNLAAQDAYFMQALQTGEAYEAAMKESDKRMRDLLERSRLKDPDAVSELNELRMERIDLYVRSGSNFASMLYETVTLKDNEQACIEHSFRNPVNARYVGQDGGARTVKAVKARNQRFIDMRELESGSVGYQMRDIQQGASAVADAAQATVDIGWDLTNKVDVEAYGLLVGGTFNGKNYGNGVYGAFTSTGAPLARTWVLHPRINQANLPLTNDITNTTLNSKFDVAGGPTTGFRLAVIRAIMAYCASYGDMFGSPLRPTGAIFIPSSESTNLAQEIVPVGIVNNPVAEGILSNFTQFDYMGVRWTLIPDVTLPLGRCYPVLNRPAARMQVKPQFDREWVESNTRKNWEERGASKCVAFYTLEAWRPFALRVAYVANPAAQQDIE